MRCLTSMFKPLKTIRPENEPKKKAKKPKNRHGNVGQNMSKTDFRYLFLGGILWDVHHGTTDDQSVIVHQATKNTTDSEILGVRSHNGG